MTDSIERFAIWTVRLVVSIFINALTLLITAWLLPGMNFVDTPLGPYWLQAISAAILIGAINLLLRPIVLRIARPLGFFLLFLVGFLLNAAALGLAAWLLPGFELNGIWAAIVASIAGAIVNGLLASLLNLGNDQSYFRQRAIDEAAKTPFPTADEPGRKLLMLEIDGLSVHHMQKALEQGYLPTVSRLISERGYVLSRVDCGIPSQTSACQAGIMFGDNHDIPAFRWFDKSQGKLIVSSSDAGELNARYANGTGLMRGGGSVSNMLNGDAYKSLMTAADLMSADKDEAKRRADDVYLLMLDPSFLLQTVARYLGMVVVELWEGWQQRRNDVYPRLNRLAHFYPFVRAATSIFLRDMGAGFATFDVVRGAPSVYVTWPGYDEVAHHSGPWTKDAFNELARYDQVVAHMLTVIEERALGHYDLILLSDHGQSFGPTFLQRYGVTLKEFIEEQLPEGTTVAAAIGGDTGADALNSAGAELKNAQQATGRKEGQGVVGRSTKLIDRASVEEKARIAAATSAANVTAYGSGNLAQVYFDLFPRKITLPELNAAYPGVVEALVGHEGIGLVCGYLEDGTPVAMSKNGTRNLHTGEIEGEDPLLMYAPSEGYGESTVETRAWQVQRVMDFPHAGDLMVISTVYEDGTVAALEELIGSHGGLGGEQTDAFIFHPPDMDVTETRNSIDVFHILNNHRGADLPAPKPVEPEPEPIDWTTANLWAGLTMVGVWVTHVFRCLIPDRDAFHAVVNDPRMTGPALLVGSIGSILYALSMEGLSDWIMIPLRVFGFLFGAVVVFGAGYVLSGKGTFARTVRAVGFAHSPTILLPLTLFDVLAPIIIVIVIVLELIGLWIGAVIAHDLKGWQSVVLPLVYLLLVTVGIAAVIILLSGTALTIQSILATLGIVVP